MDRIEITITGELPEARKYAVLAAAQDAANAMAADLGKEHGLTLAVTVKAVRPSKPKTSLPSVRAVA